MSEEQLDDLFCKMYDMHDEVLDALEDLVRSGHYRWIRYPGPRLEYPRRRVSRRRTLSGAVRDSALSDPLPAGIEPTE